MLLVSTWHVPPGLGSHIAWDTRLDGKLAQAIVSIQAVKGAEVGFAAEGAAAYGSKVQDTIHYNRDTARWMRERIRASGLENGKLTNGLSPAPPVAVRRNTLEADFDFAQAAGEVGSRHARAGTGCLRIAASL